MATAASPPKFKKIRGFPKGVTALQVLEGIDLDGAHCLVTGGNTGIGFQTARVLALHNAHVVLACRNPLTANQAMEKILTEKDDAKLEILSLDCSEMASAEDCAKEYLKRGWPLHMLILNAGVIGPLHKVTDAGFESTFQINHLSQFYLTKLLMPILLKSAPARVVVVSSTAHKMLKWGPSEITWEKLSPTHKNDVGSALHTYAVSKLCNVLFALELNNRYQSQGVTAYSIHPGVVKTNITRNSKAMNGFFKVGAGLGLVTTPEKGAATTVYCAAIPGLEQSEYTGHYFENCKPSSAVSQSGRNKKNAERLWAVSEDMIKHFQKSAEKIS